MIDPAHSVDEVEVSLTVTDGKLTAEAHSGPKAGSVGLGVVDGKAELSLHGPGSDVATVTLSGPELSTFRTIVDATISRLSVDRSAVERDQRVLYSDFETLTESADGFSVSVDADPLEKLGLLDAGGSLAGGSRQVRCTVLRQGTAIMNLRPEEEAGPPESGFQF